MKHIKLFNELEDNVLCNNITEGVDFKENFTPLYHLTSTTSLREILATNKLNIGNPARGPKGICISRNKFYTLDNSSYKFKLVLNRELLIKDGYKIYPLDEWALNRNSKDDDRKTWVSGLIKQHHLIKSNFDNIKKGTRWTKGANYPKDKIGRLEIEFEERILKNVNNLNKYLHGIVVSDMKYLDDSTIGFFKKYKNKYPDIKFYTGFDFPKEIKYKFK